MFTFLKEIALKAQRGQKTNGREPDGWLNVVKARAKELL